MDMKESLIQPNILIIETSRAVLKALKKEFEKVGGDVFPARNSTDAQRFIKENDGWVDIVVCDIDLKTPYDGMKYACKIKRKFPNMTVCLMTSRIRENYEALKDGIFCIEKNEDSAAMVTPILSHWMIEQKKKKQFEERRQRILLQLPYKDKLQFISRKSRRGVEAVDFWLVGSDPLRSIRSVYYRHPNHPLRFSCGVCVSKLCRFGCLMCEAGRDVKKCDVIDLEKSQIIAQFLHGLDSSLAFGCLGDDYELSIEATCGGDWIAKPRPVYEAIVEMDAVPELNHPLFVITTIGNLKVFREYLPKLVGYKVKIYLSVHSLDLFWRGWLLPATKGQSLEETRAILSWFANVNSAATGQKQKWTLCWMLLKGFNDSQQDIASIASFCEGYPIDVKVMLYDGSDKYQDEATAEDLKHFVQELKNKGVDARLAENMGSGTGQSPSNMTCGTTLSTQDIVEKTKEVI